MMSITPAVVATALNSPAVTWTVQQLTIPEDMRAALSPNASESSPSFLRSDTLWLLPQQWSANDSWYSQGRPDPTIFSYSNCSYSAGTPAGAGVWITLSGLESCASAASAPCQGLQFTWVTPITPLPSGVALNAASTVYLDDLNLFFAFGGRRVTSLSAATSDPLLQPVDYDLLECAAAQRALNNSFVAPVAWTFLYDLSTNVWTSLSPSQTGHDTPMASISKDRPCQYIHGLTTLYNPSMRAVYAWGAFDGCVSDDFAVLYSFNLSTYTWGAIRTSWGPPGSPTPSNCNVASLLSRGTYAWGAQDVLVVYGGVSFK